jgi:hypothetical protein
MLDQVADFTDPGEIVLDPFAVQAPAVRCGVR